MTDFERVKDAISILSLITQETGFSMKGKHLEQCPFCNGHGCFSITPDKGVYHCFQCPESGDVITFLEKYHNLSKHDALVRAAGIAGVELAQQPKPEKEKRESLKERLFRTAADYYHRVAMAEGSPAREWFCKQRGHKTETLEKMRMGWGSDGLLSYLQEQGGKGNEAIKITDVIKYGLARTKDRNGNEIPPKDYFWNGLAVFPVIDHDGKVISFTSKDPQKQYPGMMLKDIKKDWLLNHGALGRYQDLFVVEGENDIASLFDAGHENVVGTAGAPGKDQAMKLRNHCSGKTLYLWFDRDKQQPFDRTKVNGNGGPHHIRYLCHHLGDSAIVKVITHPGDAKDPDDFIQKLFKSGKKIHEVRQAVRELKSAALEPLTWELWQLQTIPEARDRLEAFKLRKLPVAINTVPSAADQEVYIDQAAKAVGISVGAIEELVTNSADLFPQMKERFRSIKTTEPLELAKYIFKWFNNGSGARFFKTRDGKFHLFYQRKIYEIGNNPDFNVLMLKLTELFPVERPGSTVWHCMTTLCNMHGEQVDLMSWLYTERETDNIYANLNSLHNKIIRLAPDTEPAVIDNGTNEHSVLLSSSLQIRQFEYQPTAGEAEGFRALKTLLMDTVPCEGPQRYFMVCWMISLFLMNYQSDRGLLQIIGSTQIGKSKVAERMSQLIYGESYVGKGTGAAETRVATQNPLTFLDNVENKNLTQGTVDFLLFVANSANKPKAKAGSDTEVMYQKLNTMAVITSIEAFPGRLPELMNRTFPLLLEPEYKQHGYMHDEIMRTILKNRNLILSSILKMICADVLPNLSNRHDWSKHLNTNHPGHNKERNNEHLCTMMLVLEGVLKYLPATKGDLSIKKQAANILAKWIAYQEEQAYETAITSNTLLSHMDGLAREIWVKIRGRDDLIFEPHHEFKCGVKVFEDPEYLETFYLTEPKDEPSDDDDEFVEQFQRLELIITSARLHTALNRYCANQHIRNPFDTATALAARMRNDKPVMQTGGWEYISKEGQSRHSQYKKISGQWLWRLSKRLRVRG